MHGSKLEILNPRDTEQTFTHSVLALCNLHSGRKGPSEISKALVVHGIKSPAAKML